MPLTLLRGKRENGQHQFTPALKAAVESYHLVVALFGKCREIGVGPTGRAGGRMLDHRLPGCFQFEKFVFEEYSFIVKNLPYDIPGAVDRINAPSDSSGGAKGPFGSPGRLRPNLLPER